MSAPSWVETLGATMYSFLKTILNDKIPHVLLNIISQYGADITSATLANRVTVIKPPGVLVTLRCMTLIGVFPIVALEHVWSCTNKKEMIQLSMDIYLRDDQPRVLEEWTVQFANSTDYDTKLVLRRPPDSSLQVLTTVSTINNAFELPGGESNWQDAGFLRDISSLTSYIVNYIFVQKRIFSGSGFFFYDWITGLTISDEMWNLMTWPSFSDSPEASTKPILRRDSRDTNILRHDVLVFFVSLLAIHRRLNPGN